MLTWQTLKYQQYREAKRKKKKNKEYKYRKNVVPSSLTVPYRFSLTQLKTHDIKYAQQDF